VVLGVIVCWVWFRPNGSSCRRDSVPVWYDHAGGIQNGEPGRRTRRSSRPLRAQDRWFFDTLLAARLRQLNGNPLGGWDSVMARPFWSNQSVSDVHARCADSVMPTLVVPV
jgi:hypothetical protein